MENTNNQSALITGGTSGIGRELAKLFAQDGYHLILVARSEDDLASTSKEISERFGVNITTISKDLMKPGAGQELYDAIKAKGIMVNVLVNDAGQGQHGNFVDYDIQRATKAEYCSYRPPLHKRQDPCWLCILLPKHTCIPLRRQLSTKSKTVTW